jgi:hypothetical protein
VIGKSVFSYHLSPITFFPWFDRDFLEHGLSFESFGNTFGFVFRERMFRVKAGYLEYSVVEHDDPERAECDAWHNLYLAHIVYAKTPGLLNPVFDERVAQGMFGFPFGQVCALYDETVFRSFIRLHGI